MTSGKWMGFSMCCYHEVLAESSLAIVFARAADSSHTFTIFMSWCLPTFVATKARTLTLTDLQGAREVPFS
jgi:hypothetical protein